jgi:hypothetical protein
MLTMVSDPLVSENFVVATDTVFPDILVRNDLDHHNNSSARYKGSRPVYLFGLSVVAELMQTVSWKLPEMVALQFSSATGTGRFDFC